MMVILPVTTQRVVAMKTRLFALCLLCVLCVGPMDTASSHSIQKRFFWKSLAQLAQPFIRAKPKPPVNNPPYYSAPYRAPPVYQLAPTVPQPVHAPPTSGQLYIPMPGTVNNAYAPNNPPVYVPPSSFGNYPQPPPNYAPPNAPPNADANWRPMAAQPDGGTLYYNSGSGVVGPPSIPYQSFQPGSSSDVSLPSGVDVADLISNPFRGSSVFLTASDKFTHDGFVQVPLPQSVLRSIVDLGLDSPTVYLANTFIPPSKDFALLEVSNETIEALRAAAQQPNSSRAAELPSPAAENLITAIKSAAPKLVGMATTVELPDVMSNADFPLDLSLGTLRETDEPAKDNDDKPEMDAVTTEQEPEADPELESVSTTTPEFVFSPEIDSSNDLSTLFLARRDADVPGDFIQVFLSDSILKALRRRVSTQTLRAQSVSKLELTEAYLAPSTSSAVKPPPGIVPVELSRRALQVLNKYANEVDKLNNLDSGPKLELPRSVLEQLSRDTSQRVRLIAGGRESVVKTGSTDVFIAPSDQKPPDGYVSIPLPDFAMSELQKNFLGSTIRSQDFEKGIPVRAYIAPADQKLPAGHVAVPLPDSVLASVRSPTRTTGRVVANSSKTTAKENNVPFAEDSEFVKKSDSAVFLAAAHKRAPSNFEKLKLPENILDNIRKAIPAERLAEAGKPAKDLTAAYIAPANEYVPPGFFAVYLPDYLVKMLKALSETKQAENELKREDDSETTTDSPNGRQGGRNGAEDGETLLQKIPDAMLKALRGTVKDLLEHSRKEGRGSNGARGNRKNNRGNSASRNNARVTESDADENEFEKSDVDEDVDPYQPQYQQSPFFPTSVSGYPYVNPYQYGELWTYGDGNSWAGESSPYYGYYATQPLAEERDAAYYYDGVNDAGAVQYAMDQPLYDMATIKKRQGETESESDGGR